LRAINSMNLLLSPGVSVAGQVVSDDQGAPLPRTVKVLIESIDSDLPSPSASILDAKGQFSADRVGSGDYSVRLVGLTGSVYMKSATSGGVDILAKPLHVDLASPAPLRISLGSDGGHLEGAVYDMADHTFDAGASVVLVPDAARRNLPSQFFVAQSGDDGRFSISGIPPGNYKLFAWQGLEPNAYLDPSFLEGYEAVGVAVSISPRSDIQASVRVIELD